MKKILLIVLIILYICMINSNITCTKAKISN